MSGVRRDLQSLWNVSCLGKMWMSNGRRYNNKSMVHSLYIHYTVHYIFTLSFWFDWQNGLELKSTKALRIYSMGRKRCLQIMESSISDSGVYTCDIGDLNSSCKLEVYGKTRTLSSTH